MFGKGGMAKVAFNLQVQGRVTVGVKKKKRDGGRKQSFAVVIR
jgi:hypothetical protein